MDQLDDVYALLAQRCTNSAAPGPDCELPGAATWAQRTAVESRGSWAGGSRRAATGGCTADNGSLRIAAYSKIPTADDDRMAR
eukprot:SAG31_NODE_89_length_26711_cov_24.949459_1_plen_83_part_00